MKSEQSLDKPHIKKNKIGMWVCSRLCGCTRCAETFQEAYMLWKNAENEWVMLEERKRKWDREILEHVEAIIYGRK